MYALLEVTAPDAVLEAGLAELTLDCVRDGDSIGFLADVTRHALGSWWHDLLADPQLVTWCAVEAGRVIGTVSLAESAPDTGRHRADVTKLLVAAARRGRGVAAALMATLEARAARQGPRLLMLDTESDSTAETVYRRLGWTEYGRLDRHAARPDGSLSATTFFAKWVG